MNGLARSEFNGRLNNIATKHAERGALRLVNKPRTNSNVGMLKSALKIGNILRQMLTIGIKLNGTIIAMTMSVFNASLKSARKTKIAGQIKEWIAICTANINRMVSRSVINDKIIDPRRRCRKLGNSGLKRFFLVICGNNNQCFQNELS